MNNLTGGNESRENTVAQTKIAWQFLGALGGVSILGGDVMGVGLCRDEDNGKRRNN